MTHALYTGTVMHARRTPTPNVFRYRVCFYLLDVDRLDTLNRLGLVGYNRRAPLAIYDRDHLGDTGASIAEKVRTAVRAHGVEPPDGTILLATNLRVFGYVFNPVSFFYLLDADGRIAMVLAEVSNTFGESRPYLLHAGNEVDGARLRSYEHPKELHVSPFFGMHQQYRFVFSEPAERLYARIDVREDGDRPFHATMVGRRTPLTRRAAARALARYPLMTARVTGLIHWQAFRLWIKGVPVIRKPPFDVERGSAR